MQIILHVQETGSTVLSDFHSTWCEVALELKSDYVIICA